MHVKKSVSKLIPFCIDAVALLSGANEKIEQTRRNNLSTTLDKTCQNLAKNVPDESEQLFGNDLTKRITNMETNQQILTKNIYQKQVSTKPWKPFTQKLFQTKATAQSVSISDQSVLEQQKINIVSHKKLFNTLTVSNC